MKFLVAIFNIYLLALSVMPCTDVHTTCSSESAILTIAENHDHASDHNDTCSPFCVCSCCNTIGTLHFTEYYLKSAKQYVALHAKFAVRAIVYDSNFFGNIWQPPKIS